MKTNVKFYTIAMGLFAMGVLSCKKEAIEEGYVPNKQEVASTTNTDVFVGNDVDPIIISSNKDVKWNKTRANLYS